MASFLQVSKLKKKVQAWVLTRASEQHAAISGELSKHYPRSRYACVCVCVCVCARTCAHTRALLFPSSLFLSPSFPREANDQNITLNMVWYSMEVKDSSCLKKRCLKKCIHSECKVKS